MYVVSLSCLALYTLQEFGLPPPLSQTTDRYIALVTRPTPTHTVSDSVMITMRWCAIIIFSSFGGFSEPEQGDDPFQDW